MGRADGIERVPRGSARRIWEADLARQGNLSNEDAGSTERAAAGVDGAAAARVGSRLVRVWHCGLVAFVLLEARRADRLSEHRVAAIERHRTTKVDLLRFFGDPTRRCGIERGSESLTWTSADAARLPLIAVGFSSADRHRDLHVRLGSDGTVEACTAVVGTGGA